MSLIHSIMSALVKVRRNACLSGVLLLLLTSGVFPVAASEPPSGSIIQPAYRGRLGSTLSLVPESEDPLLRRFFDRIELGCLVDVQAPIWGPYASWYPTDIDDDGTWELAVLTAEKPRRCGVFDPADGIWVWGPVVLPANPYQWGVGDWNSDGYAEYVYMSTDTIVRFDSRTGTHYPLWTVSVPRRSQYGEPAYVLASWGSTPSGAPALAVLEERWQGVEPCSECPVRMQQLWYWHVHDLMTGDSITSIPGGLGGRHVSGLTPGTTENLILFETFQQVSTAESWQMALSYWFQKIRLVDVQWRTIAAFDLPRKETYYSALPSCLWGLAHADVGHVPSDDRSLLVWHSRPRPCFGVDWLPYYMGVERVADSLTMWEMPFNAFWTPFHTPAVYTGMAAFDLDHNGTDELTITLSTGEGWEIRDLVTGHVLDTIPGMPAADLRTGPLFQAGTRELFFLSGSSLYVWAPDVAISMTDQSSHDHLSSPVSLAAAPNPFNAAVTLTWSAPLPPHTLEIYNVLGQRIRVFDLENRGLSGHISWDARDQAGRPLATGVYLARLVGTSESTVVKLVLLK